MHTDEEICDFVFEDRLRFVISNLRIATDLIRDGNIEGGLHIIKSCSADSLLEYDNTPINQQAVARFTLLPGGLT